MNTSKHKKGYWTKEKCAYEAQKFETRTEFKLSCPGAHTAACKNGWLDEICSHMKVLKTHYTKEECAIEALKYNTKTEFMNKAPLFYSHAIRKGFINEICKHMRKLGNPEKRVIYAFEFKDSHVYVGLTQNVNRRKTEHLSDKSSPVFKYWKENNEPFEFKILSDFISKEEAAILEDETIIRYSQEGWILLNKKRGGDLGNKIRKYTKKQCIALVLQYDNKKTFRENCPQMYNYISKRGWIDEICAHMLQIKKKNGYWTKERCAQEAKKYSKRLEFRRKSPAAFGRAFKNGWLEDICSHMSYNQYEPKIWTKSVCMTEAKKYETRGVFKKNNPTAYKAALNNGWLDELYIDHPFHGYTSKRLMIAMESRDKTNSHKYWTKERIIEKCKDFNSLTEFANKCSGAYDAARNIGIMDVIRNILKPDSIRWTKEMLQAEAYKYDNKKDFRINSKKAYDVAIKRKILEEICKHMKKK